MKFEGGYKKATELPKEEETLALLRLKGYPFEFICARVEDRGNWAILRRADEHPDSAFEGGYVIIEAEFPKHKLTDLRWVLHPEANMVLTENEPSGIVIKFTPTAVSKETLDDEIEIWRARAKKTCALHNQQLDIMSNMQ